jgi:ribonuclease BN (tRNA processing enzyme)
MKDELIFLGTGGGRHHIRTQYRATGGLLYKFNGIQAHIDPGPGAIVRINQFHEDPAKTELFVVTHFHLDHYSDISAVIESSRKILHDRDHNYFKKGTLITTNQVMQYISEYHLNMLEKKIIFHAGDKMMYKGVNIIGTQIKHSNMEGFGLKFNLDNNSLGYTSDSKVFEGFATQFNDTDILILNLLRPDSIICKKHLCTDQVIPYLNKITPKPAAVILTHFGAYMDSPFSKKNYVPSQVEKIKKLTNVRNVIGAYDGLKLEIEKLLK